MNTTAVTPAYLDLKKKTAFITGSSRGIGFAIARSLAVNGVRVALNGRNVPALDMAVGKIRDLGGEALAVPADFTDSNAIQSACRQVLSHYGRLDILTVNMGGEGEPVPTVQETEAHWRRVVDVNLTSAFLTVRSFLPSMIANGQGNIIMISSTAGRQASQASAAYSAAKAGIVMLVRHLANELGSQGVRVNCIAPGAVLTEGGFLAEAPREVQERVAAMHPVGRIGRPDDIANATLYLASDASSWITGIALDVSGAK